MAASGSPSRGRRPQLPEEVAVHIREQIITGQVQEGEYLRLDQLAEDLGISVTPVREALIALSAEGFVELEPRQGFAVAPPSRQDLDDIFELRALLAGGLAGRCAGRITGERVRELRALQHELSRVHELGDGTTATELLNRFHRELGEASGARKLAWFFELASRYAPREQSLAAAGWPEACVRDHGAVLRALEDGDPTVAEETMREHLRTLGHLLIEHLDARDAWPERRDD
ncbi:DNA-binding transcriptional regulator, GntR family [Actinopolyspora alba]|uniref:DNA-binding transcriptional regulator, GntR family n=1 Tax=Actinopolyspora alba TaxID=673379 RepID=A0A1I1VAC9_9ACTN|nr:GntR family transcriptional regulator [Actinopolyspora alba]SFD79849.1 DNA-binding transcriptional regulator, GntR family [Actinopolyspora alba]